MEPLSHASNTALHPAGFRQSAEFPLLLLMISMLMTLMAVSLFMEMRLPEGAPVMILVKFTLTLSAVGLALSVGLMTYLLRARAWSGLLSTRGLESVLLQLFALLLILGGVCWATGILHCPLFK